MLLRWLELAELSSVRSFVPPFGLFSRCQLMM